MTAGIAAPAYAGHPRHVPRRGQRGRVRHRPRGPGQAGDGDRLGGARALPGHARLLHGRPPAPADRRAADRQRPPRRRARRDRAGRARCPASAASSRRSRSSPEDAEGIRAPAVTIIGPVAALRDELAWFERRPLSGRSVVVTRARAQASALAARLRELGATVVEAPAIRIEPLDGDAPGPRRLRPALRDEPERRASGCSRSVRDARALAGPTIAAIGPGTARALRAGGIEPDVVPERAVAEGLVEALDGRPRHAAR